MERLPTIEQADPTHPSVGELWERYRARDSLASPTPPGAFHFCDNQTDADVCLALVLSGRKRATAGSFAEYEMAGDPLPVEGQFSIVTDWRGEAGAVIRTTAVEVRRFGEVDEKFARAEGEGDGTLAWWREAHRAYFERVLAGRPIKVDDDLAIVCEHFELVFPSL